MKYKEWKKRKFYTFKSFLSKKKQKRCNACSFDSENIDESFDLVVKSKFIHWLKYHRK